MAKKFEKNEPKAELIPEDPDIEKRVKEMMEPEPPAAKDAALDNKPAGANEPGSAPEINELPVPDEPLKIKILRGDDEAEADPPTAPELTPEAGEPQPDESEAEETPPDPAAGETEPETVDTENTDSETEEAPAEPETAAEPDSAPASGPAQDAPADEDEPPEDSETAQAVDDIVRQEGDELLQAKDEKLLAAVQPKKKQSLGQKLKAALYDLWKNPRKRKIVIVTLVCAVLAAGIVPSSRYFVLNAVGVRASASVYVVDESTQQPLRNVRVNIQGIEAKTDENGDARIDKLKLGPSHLIIERRAFASVERGVTIGWGSNPLGEEKLRPTGTQYAFLVTDYFSGKGVFKAEAISGEASAFSNEEGKILLTMEDPADEIDISITSEGRRTESFKLNADTKTETNVKMVPARKHAYITRREGRYDVYAVYADGKEDELVLKGTGSERDDMVLVPHPTENIVALVSTRDGARNKDGFMLSNLNIIDLRTKSIEAVQSSERIQIIGWFGERLVYVRVVSGASAGNPKRNRLMAYHYKDDTNNELAASNYFNDVTAMGDRIFYAPSGAYANGVNVDLFSIKADGSDRKVILDKEVWNMFRTSYDRLALSAPGAWYDYRAGDAGTTKLDGEPANLKPRIYVNSPNNEKALWVDSRDGKGVLIVHDVKSGEEKVLHTQNGLKNPALWLNSGTIVYRVKTDGETADYAISLDGGEAKKVADVTDTDGVDRWYYY